MPAKPTEIPPQLRAGIEAIQEAAAATRARRAAAVTAKPTPWPDTPPAELNRGLAALLEGATRPLPVNHPPAVTAKQPR